VQKGQVVTAEVRRLAAREEGAVEPHRAGRAAGVPGVADAVAVLVPEVVCLPRVRGQDDGDPVPSEPGRPDDQRRVSDPAIGGGETRVVEAGRPVPDPNADPGRAVRMRPPADRDGPRYRDPVQDSVPVGGDVLGPRAEELERQRGGVGRDLDRGHSARHRALAREARVDPEHADDGGARGTHGAGWLDVVATAAAGGVHEH
jgi:hypothetical protein